MNIRDYNNQSWSIMYDGTITPEGSHMKRFLKTSGKWFVFARLVLVLLLTCDARCIK